MIFFGIGAPFVREAISIQGSILTEHFEIDASVREQPNSVPQCQLQF